jgi:hypothetical protein
MSPKLNYLIYKFSGLSPAIMIRRVFIHLLAGVLFIASYSCKEIYYPVVDSMENVIIVDGIITDQPGGSVIKLRYYKETGDISELPATSAAVYVFDDHNNIITFDETNPAKPGHYFPASSFEGVAGRSYTLHIETENGENYVSDPQIMNSPASIEDINASYTVREYMAKDFNGNYYKQKISGIEAFTGISSDQDILRVRIEPTLLLLYTYNVIIPGFPEMTDYFFLWKKILLTDEPNINLHTFHEGNASVKVQKLGFLPEANYHYGLPLDYLIYRKILIIRTFALNDDSHRFYSESYKQISSENKLFDPVVSQLPTNIRCTSNPKKPVAGFFEASSSRCETYRLVERKWVGEIDFFRIADLEDVPSKGMMQNEVPYFWFYE